MFFWHSLVDMTDSPRTAGEGKYRNIKTTIKYCCFYMCTNLVVAVYIATSIYEPPELAGSVQLRKTAFASTRI